MLETIKVNRFDINFESLGKEVTAIIYEQNQIIVRIQMSEGCMLSIHIDNDMKIINKEVTRVIVDDDYNLSIDEASIVYNNAKNIVDSFVVGIYP